MDMIMDKIQRNIERRKQRVREVTLRKRAFAPTVQETRSMIDFLIGLEPDAVARALAYVAEQRANP